MDPEPGEITVGNLTEQTKQTELTDSRNFPDVLSYAKKIAPKLGKKLGVPPEDLLQKFLTRLVAKWYSLEEVRFPKAWTYTSLRRIGLNQVRDNKRERNSTEPLEWDNGHSKEGYACKQEGIACSF